MTIDSIIWEAKKKFAESARKAADGSPTLDVFAGDSKGFAMVLEPLHLFPVMQLFLVSLMGPPETSETSVKVVDPNAN